MNERWKRPSLVADILKQAVQKWNLGPTLARAGVMTEWAKIVGSPLALRSRPLRFQGEMLWVEVDHPAWVQELNLLKTQVLRKIASEFPEARVRKLHFILKK